MAGHIVEVLYDGKARLGEGPFYDEETEELIYVDMSAHTVNFLNIETKENRAVSLSSKVSAAIPVEGSRDQVVVTVGRKICLMDRQTGALQDLVQVEEDKPNNSFNDAKCDPSGRLWAGTLYNSSAATGFKMNQGALYMFSKGVVTKKLSDISMSNGMAWNKEQTTMYYIDSIPRKVYSFDYSAEKGEISNQRVVKSYFQDEKRLGWPDGMTIDTDGNVWVASFNGEAGVTCWSPAGERLQEVTIPAPACTSCCFGGPDFSWLFVTSATEYIMTEEKWRMFPHAGAVFVVKNLGVRGVPNYRFNMCMTALF